MTYQVKHKKDQESVQATDDAAAEEQSEETPQEKAKADTDAKAWENNLKKTEWYKLFRFRTKDEMEDTAGVGASRWRNKSFVTDSVVMHTLQRRRVEKEPQRKRGKQRLSINRVYVPVRTTPNPASLDEKPKCGDIVVGIDPGARDVVAVRFGTVMGDNESVDWTPKRFRIPAKEWHRLSGRTKAWRKSVFHLDALHLNNKDGKRVSLAAYLRNLPVKTPSSVEGVVERAAAEGPVLHAQLALHRLPNALRAKARTGIQRERCLQRLGNRILRTCNSCKDVAHPDCRFFVLMGDGQAGALLGLGHPRAPQHQIVRALQRHPGLQFHLVDEYKTSQLCASCSSQLKAVKNPKTGRSMWSLKYCPKCKCQIHRDYNGAENIGNVFVYTATREERPAGFQRPPKNGTGTGGGQGPGAGSGALGENTRAPAAAHGHA